MGRLDISRQKHRSYVYSQTSRLVDTKPETCGARSAHFPQITDFNPDFRNRLHHAKKSFGKEIRKGLPASKQGNYTEASCRP
jgi:hypothetical protein